VGSASASIGWRGRIDRFSSAMRIRIIVTDDLSIFNRLCEGEKRPFEETLTRSRPAEGIHVLRCADGGGCGSPCPLVYAAQTAGGVSDAAAGANW